MTEKLQRIISIYFQEWIPYSESLRAMPLPDPDSPRIRNREGMIRCQETRTRDTEREERRIVSALDAAEALSEAMLLTKKAIDTLSQRERETVATLARYCDSDLLFDFAACAHAWTVGERGPRPRFNNDEDPPEYYNAWKRSKGEKKKRLEDAWKRISKKLESLLLKN